MDLPVAPAGEQNAPGVTINELLVATGVGVAVITGALETVGVGVGVTEGEMTGVGVIVGVALVVEVGVALIAGVGVGELDGTTLISPIITFVKPQSVTKFFNVLASAVLTVKSYLHLTAIQLDT